MEAHEDLPAPTPIQQAIGEEEPDNLLEQLAAKRREISETREVDIPVPGYDSEPPLLLIRYRLLDGHTMILMGDKIRRQNKDMWTRALYAALDTFIAACVGIYVDLGGGVPEPLTYHGQVISGFTIELAKALQFDTELGPNPTARDIVMGLFADNDVAVTQHAFMLNRWFQNTSIDVNAELLGGNL